MSDEKMLAKLETLDSSTFRPEFQQVPLLEQPSNKQLQCMQALQAYVHLIAGRAAVMLSSQAQGLSVNFLRSPF